MSAIERQSAGGHDTMHVRVMFEFLIPGVEHTEEADLGAEMFGIASDFEEGCGTGLQQEMVENLLVDFATLNWPHFDHYIWPHPNR